MDPSPAPPTAIELLRQRVRAVFHALPQALSGNEDAIHEMRVAGRRLRVALSLLAQKPEGRRVKRARRILRDLTRTAGKSRDLDVSLKLLEERLADPPSPARQSLRRRLQGSRRYTRARLTEELLDLDVARLRRDLKAIVARAGRVDSVPDDRFAARLAKERDGLVGALDAVGDEYDPVALHEVRRFVRRLRYAAEVAELLRGGDGSASARPWKKLQTPLGRIHDHHLLGEWLEGQRRAATERGDRALAAEAGSQKAWAERTARALHRELVLARPSHAVREAVDELLRAGEAA